MTIGERLKMLRGKITQAEAAARIGMKQQSWRIYETDGSAPGAKLIQRICETFGVSSDWLLGLEKEKGGIIATNSAVVIGSGVAVNGAADQRDYGKSLMCKRCPYKKRVEKIAKIAASPVGD